MKDWFFEDGLHVVEDPWNHNLHCFKCYRYDVFLGFVFPSNLADMRECLRLLDCGEDPISGSWDDGFGNSCQYDGWSHLQDYDEDGEYKWTEMCLVNPEE